MSRFSTVVNLTAFLGLGIFSPSSYAALLGQYTFEGDTVTASSVSSGTTFSNFGSAVVTPNNGGFVGGNPGRAITRSNWSLNSTYDSTKYYDFTVTPNSGNTLSLTNLVFDAQRSGTGPSSLEVRSSLDNYATAIASPVSPSNNSFASSLTTTLSGFSNIANPLNLRIYGYNATGTGGTLRLDNVQLNGDVNGTNPPPSTPFVSIYGIQGAGSSSPFVGQTVKTQGVVVGSFLGSDQLNGFFIQDNTNANDPTLTGASNGIFVSAASVNSLSIGSLVEVVGQVSESFNKTQITLSDALSVLGTGSISPTNVTLPVTSSDYLERYEGMLVTLPQTLTVTDNFGLGRFGEVGLSSGDRLYQPTQVTTPGAAANALQAQNNLNFLTLDDGSNTQNPDPIPYPSPELTASNTLRVGEQATGVTGVVDFGFSKYRIQPTAEPTFNTVTNPRPSSPPSVDGDIKVGDFNLENYFTTLGSRGAQTAFEFERQQDKLVSALLGLNADVFGIEEVENNGYGPDSAIASLVNALNDVAGAGTYSYINPGVSQLGTDAIAVGLLYKPSKVSPVGNAAILDTGIFNPSINRPSLAQTFIGLPNTEQFTVNVNHFKSKGGTASAAGSCSASDNADQGDGQAGFNCTRTLQASELTQWLGTNPTNSNTSHQIILGDLNSYAKEDPITKIEFAGYTNLDLRFGGADTYSYLFGGQSGTLDYAFSSPSLNPFVTGASPWHINADEPTVLGYSTAFKSPNQITSLYAPDAYASSDHDPVLVGLRLQTVPEPGSVLGFFLLGVWGLGSKRQRKKP